MVTLFGLDLIVAAAILLLVLGVVGSVAPLLPGAELSLAGIYLYWWHSGYSDPGLAVLVGFTLVGLVVIAVDYGAGAISAKAGGASWTTSAVAGVVSLVLFLVTGPIGILVGTAGTVFVIEYYRNEDARQSARAAVFTTIGILGSAAVQVVVTLAMLVAFLVVIFL